ncbi:type II toxin-antitoxin system VapC family toxin [Ectothiorhodospiraceae bacterium BW-2]|nr:type II toxin-antitoxin system VapC family toxin [Ectothiorhodospiraceae bacterium BW-2]
MIILDTNVLSELIRLQPDMQVIHWFRSLQNQQCVTTTITRAEIRYGIGLLPEGKRKHQLQQAVIALFQPAIVEQVLPFDTDAADCYAEIAILRRQHGLPISQSDAMIAAITKTHTATLATRNIKDFHHCGIALIDPWNREEQVR